MDGGKKARRDMEEQGGMGVPYRTKEKRNIEPLWSNVGGTRNVPKKSLP